MAGQHYEALDTVLEWRPFEMAKQIGVSLLPGEKPCDVDEIERASFYRLVCGSEDSRMRGMEVGGSGRGRGYGRSWVDKQRCGGPVSARGCTLCG
eukprot:3223419-Rhodomonas_salina.2